jgi:hypothetical protein
MESRFHLREDARAFDRVRSHPGQLVDAIMRNEFTLEAAREHDHARIGIRLRLAQ